MDFPSRAPMLLISLDVLSNIARARGYDPQSLLLQQLDELIEVCRRLGGCDRVSENQRLQSLVFHRPDEKHSTYRAEFANYLRTLADKFDS